MTATLDLHAARRWINWYYRCESGLMAETCDDYTDQKVSETIEKLYPGGLAGFVADSEQLSD